MPHSETPFYRATTRPSPDGPLEACSDGTAHRKKQLRDNEAHATNEEGTNQPVMKTRGGSVSESEVERKLSSAGIRQGELPRNRKGKTSFQRPEALLCAVPLTTHFSIPRTSICPADSLGEGKDKSPLPTLHPSAPGKSCSPEVISQLPVHEQFGNVQD